MLWLLGCLYCSRHRSIRLCISKKKVNFNHNDCHFLETYKRDNDLKCSEILLKVGLGALHLTHLCLCSLVFFQSCSLIHLLTRISNETVTCLDKAYREQLKQIILKT